MKSYWSRVDTQPHLAGALPIEENDTWRYTHIHTEYGHLMIEAELGAMQPGAKECHHCWPPPGAARGRKDPALHGLEGEHDSVSPGFRT